MCVCVCVCVCMRVFNESGTKSHQGVHIAMPARTQVEEKALLIQNKCAELVIPGDEIVSR